MSNIKRIKIQLLLWYFCVTLCLPGAAFAAESDLNVAIINSRSMAPYQLAIKGIKQKLADSHYKLHYQEYVLDGKFDEVVRITQEIHKKKAQLVYLIGTEATVHFSHQFEDVPVVSTMVYDPMNDLPEHISKTKENLYCVGLKVPIKDRVELLSTVFPQIKSVAIIFRTERQALILQEIQKIPSDGQVKVFPVAMESLKDFDKALSKARGGADALLMVLDQKLYNKTTAEQMLLFSARHQFPIIAYSKNYGLSGALVAFFNSYLDHGSQAGVLGLELMKNNPRKMLFLAPNKISVYRNKKVAEAFGLSHQAMPRTDDEVVYDI